ncbi:glycosyltransferase [Paraburkholderia bannensis]|uniref:glycosyltransferase n=1 Tax=Paraburkholderia bannensis TaxID=765414 RepID=UPI0009FD5361|nr:glycosyltransferase [Paraburkholderia bannensis]
MIGIVIPVHNEAELLAACLAAIRSASRHSGLMGEPVQTVVVLDTCSDQSEVIAKRFPVETLRIDARNVGAARRAGARVLLEREARWLAFTDADSRVAADWIVAQLGQGAEAVCGSVHIDDWGSHPAQVRDSWRERYCDADGHRHVHGANLGVSTSAYLRAGEFQALCCGEDVALVEMLSVTGASIAWSAAPRVATSARTTARVRGGFGDTLASWAEATGTRCAEPGCAPPLIREPNNQDEVCAAPPV